MTTFVEKIIIKTLTCQIKQTVFIKFHIYMILSKYLISNNQLFFMV